MKIEKRVSHLPSQRLRGFLLASALIHASVLLPWAPVLQFAGQSETVVSVSLNLEQPAAATPAQSLVQPAARRTSQRQGRTGLEPHSHTVPTPPVSQASAADEAPSSNAQSADAGVRSDQTARAHVRALLLTDLQRYFEYPAMARQRGWQGLVWLSVTVQPDGALDDIHVTRSSGYHLLDSSAIAAMRRVRLAEATHWLNGRALEMPLPIVYRLIDH